MRAPEGLVTLGPEAECTLGPVGVHTLGLVEAHTLDLVEERTLGPEAEPTPVLVAAPTLALGAALTLARAEGRTQGPVGAPTRALEGHVTMDPAVETPIRGTDPPPVAGRAYHSTAARSSNPGSISPSDCCPSRIASMISCARSVSRSRAQPSPRAI